LETPVLNLNNENQKEEKIHTVISGKEFSFLTKSFSSETVCVCALYSSPLENINKIIKMSGKESL
jgi:hypothetical protein